MIAEASRKGLRIGEVSVPLKRAQNEQSGKAADDPGRIPASVVYIESIGQWQLRPLAFFLCRNEFLLKKVAL